MNNEKIIINISPLGDVEIDAQGFQGNTCSTATHELELVLGAGAQAKSDKKKPEYYAPASTKSANKLTF